MQIPAAKDIIQECNGNLEEPEIRVWCHPHKINRNGDDYYQVFDSFKEALQFISEHPEAEEAPLVAFRGYELNLWEMEPNKSTLAKV